MGTELHTDVRDGDEVVLDLADDSVGSIMRVGRDTEWDRTVET